MNLPKLTLLFLLLAISAWPAEEKESIEALKARAATADGKKQIELMVEVAERQVKAAEVLYAEGKSDQAAVPLKDVVEYSVKACTAAGERGKRMKQTEIAVRKIGKRLEDLRRSVAFDDRAPLANAVETVEKARSDLLQRMFKK